MMMMMNKNIAAKFCVAALLAASAVSGAPDNLEDLIPTNLNEIVNDIGGDAGSLLNDPAFLASASAALQSVNGFLSSNPDVVSSIMQEFSLPTIPVAGDDEGASSSRRPSNGGSEDDGPSSGASSIKLLVGAVAAVGLTALTALF
ncbi:hypothetical protein LPJ56_000720 [Coemansia sp. RSA 2599]|nr:hypothetical protein LPJ75_000301 [Coemansia sp. RSA 2598]KAJ1828991.1 hypothetical protein LPJ56_000720 [Coemansia sp. RSA 2599]